MDTGSGDLCEKLWQAVSHPCVQQGVCSRACETNWYVFQRAMLQSLCYPLSYFNLFLYLGPKNDPPTAVQEKVLSLIQSWADAFRSQPDLLGVVQVYSDLKQKGIEFPMTNLDTMAPIHTPQRVCIIPN